MVGTKRLITKRLLLRRLTEKDAEEFFTNWASDPEVTKFLSWKSHTSIDETKYSLNKRKALYSLPTYYDWGIVTNDDHTLIGTITGVNVVQIEKRVEIGYVIGKRWWGNGYVAEALSKVIFYLYNLEGYKRIFAKHDILNIQSERVMEKCGMKKERVFEEIDMNGEVHIKCLHRYIG